MSYAGTYGPDETCKHDNYRPQCWRCNGRVPAFAREYEGHVRHVTGLPESITASPRTVYDAICPACPWKGTDFATPEAAREAYGEHAAEARRVLDDWTHDTAMWAEVAAQGIAAHPVGPP